MQIYMKRNKLSKEKHKMYGKGAPGSEMELSPVLKEINRLKETLMLKGIKGAETSERDPAQMSFHLVTGN